MTRDEWIQVPQDEWRRRLVAARELACARLSRRGIEDDADNDSVAGHVLESAIGSELVPSLAAYQRDIDSAVKRLNDPVVSAPDAHGDDPRENLSELIFNYAMAVADAAFLFGVITGSHVPWQVVEHKEAPYAPPAKKAPRAKRRNAR